MIAICLNFACITPTGVITCDTPAGLPEAALHGWEDGKKAAYKIRDSRLVFAIPGQLVFDAKYTSQPDYMTFWRRAFNYCVIRTGPYYTGMPNFWRTRSVFQDNGQKIPW